MFNEPVEMLMHKATSTCRSYQCTCTLNLNEGGTGGNKQRGSGLTTHAGESSNTLILIMGRSNTPYHFIP